MINDVDSKDAVILKELTRILPNNGERDVSHGVIFFGVNGKNETSPDSPSWYNKEEATRVSVLMKLRNLF